MIQMINEGLVYGV